MAKPHTSFPSSTSRKLGIDRDSHMISKLKPKVRIIHIYAPEIIKTDVANFRELVQRLTGKPDDDTGGISKTMKPPTTKDLMNLHPKQMTIEEEEEFLGLQNGKRVKSEEDKEEEDDEIWRRSKSTEKLSGFLDGFSDLDGFMEELGVLPAVN
ncbi:hypothetical protein L6164_018047 [Bauhinia variegata]|uniref:Uncharacterized protein n=1 Tax=Bauhinia variegata TaxID=167791 RepID=A0ACB9NAL7_BAUVA|nr:hypothetical protein L6164_018047 [Bauhinia variegata]